jgi:filamentous hemagglutinin family protein
MRKSYLLLFFFVLLQWYPKPIHSAQFKNWYNTNYVQDIKSTNNKIVIGSTRGLVIFTPEDNEFITLNKIEGLLENRINGLVCDNENIFLFVPSGITVISVDTTKIRNISSLITGIQGEPMTGLLQADTLFLGTTSYLYIWDTEGDPYNPFNTGNTLCWN